MNRKHLFQFVIALLIVYTLSKIDYSYLLRTLNQMSLWFLAGILMLQLVSVLLVTYQWYSLTNHYLAKTSFLTLLLINFKGNIADAITPGVKVGGEITRVLALSSSTSSSKIDSFNVVFVQKSLSLLSFILIFMLSLVIGIRISASTWLLLMASVFVSIFILCIVRQIVCQRINHLRVQSKYPWISKSMETLKASTRELGLLLRLKRFGWLHMGLALLIWVLYGVKFILLIYWFEPTRISLVMMAITYIAYAVALLPISIGGVGSFEAAVVYLLIKQGLSYEVGIVIAVVFRFITFWFEFIVSVIYLYVLKIKGLIGGKA